MKNGECPSKGKKKRKASPLQLLQQQRFLEMGRIKAAKINLTNLSVKYWAGESAYIQETCDRLLKGLTIFYRAKGLKI